MLRIHWNIVSIAMHAELNLQFQMNKEHMYQYLNRKFQLDNQNKEHCQFQQQIDPLDKLYKLYNLFEAHTYL